MDLNEYNAVLQQLSSTPGVQERLRKMMGMQEALKTIHLNNVLPNQPQSEWTLGPENTRFLANQNYNSVQALPYQVGPSANQAWPGDPNYNGPIEQDPQVAEQLLRYMQSLLGFQSPRFTLPQAPSLQ